MLNAPAAARRAIPSVDRLLKLEAAQALVSEHGRPLVVEAIRRVLGQQRARVTNGEESIADDSALLAICAGNLQVSARRSLTRVFNLTGTVLHTNLGRALLPQSAVAAVVDAMTQAVNLEFDIENGVRGERDDHVESLILDLTGAEAATVVNNNAAAVYLALNTLAPRKEVIVSRGELIEIGGAFRIPDIMSRSGCRLREIGTTNRTHAADYTAAISDRTAAIMKVHTSNYAIQGFTKSVSESELAGIAHENALPLLVDLGSGTLVDLERYELPHEPTVREAIAAGADLVTFSGDKLLGGPQCGIIAGRRDLLAKVRKNPLKRALRVDKLILAALEATLRLYLNPDCLVRDLPTVRLLARAQTEIAEQAQRVLPAVKAKVGEYAEAEVLECMSQIGSGALPVDSLPSHAIALTPLNKRRGSAVTALAHAFRALPVPVIGRVQEGRLIFDLRCLEDEAGFLAQLDKLEVSKSFAADGANDAKRKSTGVES